MFSNKSIPLVKIHSCYHFWWHSDRSWALTFVPISLADYQIWSPGLITQSLVDMFVVLTIMPKRGKSYFSFLFQRAQTLVSGLACAGSLLSRSITFFGVSTVSFASGFCSTLKLTYSIKFKQNDRDISLQKWIQNAQKPAETTPTYFCCCF